MKKLALDIDGVIYPWQEVVWEDFVLRNKTTLDFASFWKEFFKEKNKMFQDNVVLTKTYYTKRVPTKKLIELLKDLAKEFDLYYITARPAETKLVTDIWFDRYNLPCKEKIIFTENKKEAVVLLGIDILVEDSYLFANQCSNFCSVFLVDRPYNKGKENLGVKRINNIFELKENLKDDCKVC
jgi:uncharacterized HAD superfamily protein